MNVSAADAAALTLASLAGRWLGSGTVSLPSMAPRQYIEEIRFATRSPTSLDYWQRAVDRSDGSMLHGEAGIWRVTAAGTVEISVALPGATEVSEGSVDGGTIRLESTTIGRAATGARLISTVRIYELTRDELAYDIRIATESFALIGHLRGVLRRSSTVD